MKLKDLTTLPKVRDSYSYLYVEHCKIEQDAKAIALFDLEGKTSVPCANLTTLMLGPGTTITHAAVKTLADNGCLVMWSGEGAVRFYAQGMGETRGAGRLLRQAFLSSVPTLRLRVVRRMYEMRFDEVLPEDMTLQQIRGREGVRVRTAYSQASRATGVQWAGRQYNRTAWADSSPINRALSSANSCLYGVCQAAIVSAGYSTALGFIHTGKMLSFVYDIADLYKAELTIPVAFQMVAESETEVESRIRHALRDRFHETRFLSKIIPDLERALDVQTDDAEVEFDLDEAAPGGLWDGGDSSVKGGVNWADREDQLSAEVLELVQSVRQKLDREPGDLEPTAAEFRDDGEDSNPSAPAAAATGFRDSGKDSNPSAPAAAATGFRDSGKDSNPSAPANAATGFRDSNPSEPGAEFQPPTDDADSAIRNPHSAIDPDPDPNPDDLAWDKGGQTF